MSGLTYGGLEYEAKIVLLIPKWFILCFIFFLFLESVENRQITYHSITNDLSFHRLLIGWDIFFSSFCCCVGDLTVYFPVTFNHLSVFSLFIGLTCFS